MPVWEESGEWVIASLHFELGVGALPENRFLQIEK
jgi:hypothetical protein